MARNTFTLDGIPLTDPYGRWFHEKGSGLRIIPSKRVASISYPGWDGEAFSKGEPLTPGGMSIKMYVEGIDHEDFLQNLEFITGLFMQRHKLLDLVHHYRDDDSANRVAKVKFVGGSTPKMLSPTQAIVEFIAEVPDGLWRGDDLITTTVGAMTVNTVYYDVSGLAGSTAPMSDALYRIKGGFTSATIGDAASEQQLVCSATVSASQWLLIDAKGWKAEIVDVDTWNFGGGTPVILTSSRGFGPMFMVSPVISGGILTYRIRTRCVSPTGTPVLEMRNYKEYI